MIDPEVNGTPVDLENPGLTPPAQDPVPASTEDAPAETAEESLTE